MATTRSDIIIPEVFTPYVIEQSTLRDAFLASGVVQPMAELNATEGGDTIQVPHWKANLSGDFQNLTDSTSLVPKKIQADKQIGVIVHRGDAWSFRDLAKLAAGDDPAAVLGVKMAEYVANQRQKDLLATAQGVFGALAGGDSPAFSALRFDTSGMTTLGPRQCAKARSLLGDQGDKLTAVAMHSMVYYDLQERKVIEYVTQTEARLATAPSGATSVAAFGGSTINAYTGEVTIPTYMGMRVIVSDDLVPTSTNYPIYFFAQGAIASGEQAEMQTETDRDILAKESAVSIDLHYCYHPIGARWGGPVNPTQAQLSTVGNWTKVFETKNIGIVRGTVTSNY